MFDFIAIPFGYILRAIYDFVGSYGLSIVLFTILTKVILYPLMLKSKKSMRKITKLQPKMNELQKQYANNKQKYQEEVAKLYETEKVNPLGSCLPTFATLPIMLGLYYVIQRPLTYMMQLSSDQIAKIAESLGVVSTTPLQQLEISIANMVHQNFDAVSSISDKIIPIDFNFLGFNLAGTPSITSLSILILVPIISAGTSFASMIITQKLQGTTTEGQPPSLKAMLYMMPLMSGYFGFILPAGVSLYWIMGNILMIAQELLMHSHFKKIDAKEEFIEREKKEREENNRRREMEIKKEEQRRIAKEIEQKKK